MKYIKTYEKMNFTPKYKVGDIVICVDPDEIHGLIWGNKYKINHMYQNSYGEWFSYVDGFKMSFYSSRFTTELEYNADRYNL